MAKRVDVWRAGYGRLNKLNKLHNKEMRPRDGGQVGETSPLGQKDSKTLEICRGRGASKWLKTNFVPVFL